MTTQFIGEHLLPGRLGSFFVVLSFVAALVSTFSYFKAASTEATDIEASKTWRTLARSSFWIHALSIVAIFVALFYIIENHLFEYQYAWQHSSRDLPAKYLLSCFWEGQQGSFMLWMFWHCVLGLIVMYTAKGLETRTMTIVGLTQAFLGTMILGLYFGKEIQVGDTPFQLLRVTMQNAPIFAQPNYMSFITDGNGLNISLQNYWMVIHPPVLFLGFALTLIPFALMIAALWKKDYTSFVKPALGWSLACGAVLGTGIMMGGRWAYESLNFGGYWAWDPVENASLVPWLVLVAGLHTLLVYKATGRAFVATVVFLLLSNLLVWYSTFLTRTGVLTKTSVHAFTGDGHALYYHLLLVIAVLLLISLTLLIRRWKQLPTIKTEEDVLTREFWMFVGAAVVFIGSLHIILVTSEPVYAPLIKMFTGKEPAPAINVMQSYNNVQVWIAVVIGLLSGMVLYFKYKKTDARTAWRRIGTVALIALAMSVTIQYLQHITMFQYALMLFTCCFSIVASIFYGIAIQKAKFRNLGPVTAHLGFGMVLLGILLSSYNKHTISYNTAGLSLNMGKATAEENARESNENQILFLGTPTAMGDYFATYLGDSSVPGKDKRQYFRVRFDRIDSNTHKVTESFMLYPDAFINPKGMGLTSNPDTKHYLDHDIYTFINQALDKSKSDTSQYYTHSLSHAGDTIFLNDGYMVYQGLKREINNKNYEAMQGDLPVCAAFRVYNLQGFVQELDPVYVIEGNQSTLKVEDTVHSMDVYARLDNIKVISKDSVTADIAIRQTDPKDDFIVLKALVFPYINVLWAGVIVMVLGFFISLGKVLGGRKKTASE